MPVVVTDDPDGTRAFYESFLGFEVVMDEDGFPMLSSPSVPTTELIVCWASETAMDPEVQRVADRRALGHPPLLRARAERDDGPADR